MIHILSFLLFSWLHMSFSCSLLITLRFNLCVLYVVLISFQRVIHLSSFNFSNKSFRAIGSPKKSTYPHLVFYSHTVALSIWNIKSQNTWLKVNVLALLCLHWLITNEKISLFKMKHYLIPPLFYCFNCDKINDTMFTDSKTTILLETNNCSSLSLANLCSTKILKLLLLPFKRSLYNEQNCSWTCQSLQDFVPEICGQILHWHICSLDFYWLFQVLSIDVFFLSNTFCTFNNQQSFLSRFFLLTWLTTLANHSSLSHEKS